MFRTISVHAYELLQVRTEEQLVEVNTITTGADTRLIVCQINIFIGRDFETDGRARNFDQYGKREELLIKHMM
uniref:Uncharacterized protein n=1 Tax=Tanacetum cinerariifolium TaxID=118510 RepID=A0A6L2KQ79_TANCI|nr:hypothetical protein [Tanacetum cinerariifolium]